MPTFIGLVEYTQEGVETFEGHPERMEGAREAIEALGGELKAYYNTLGQYDAVAIGEFPDAEAAMMNSLIQAKEGTVRIETLRAFDEEEVKRVIERLPD